MDIFEQVKKYYDMGIYKDDNVKSFVVKGVITKKQYKEITGKSYKA